MTFLSALITILTPFYLLLIPGLGFLKHLVPFSFFARTTRLILLSLTINSLLVIITMLVRLPITIVMPIGALLTIGLLLFQRPTITRPGIAKSLLFIILFLVIFTLFSLPFLNFHQALPTGDSQKSIIWANQVLERGGLPTYTDAKQLLNRDPVDFYTPALHGLTALAMSTSPHPLTAVGFLAITLSLIVAIIIISLTELVVTKKQLPLLTMTLSATFLLSQVRFLRYLREPGYHFQNVAGEVMLFGALYLAISLLKKWRLLDGLLLVATLLTLFLTHQLSAFLAIFLLIPILVIGLHRFRHIILTTLRQQRILLAAVIATLLILVFTTFTLGLHHKIPHLFTTAPHLAHLTPTITDYPRLMGLLWILLGLAGLLISLRKSASLPVRTLAVTTIVLLVLSQGPRLGINIPPVRVLFYLAVPFSIFAALAVSHLLKTMTSKSDTRFSLLASRGAILLIITALGINFTSTIKSSYALSHTISTNSTLLPEQLILIDHIKRNQGAVLIDDSNRRSASWLVLGNQPMFTRIASDITRPMAEARQSEQRYQLYLKLLDFEKIFSLGSHPTITELLAKHDITHLTGIAGSSNQAFLNNPALIPSITASDTTLYQARIRGQENDDPSTINNWLLRPTTLVNDIGDPEDNFKHLPASLRTNRLSDPKVENITTYRTTTASLIPLFFNIGDYVTALWDQENTMKPDTSTEFLIQIPNNTSPLTLETTTGATYQVTPGEPIKLKPGDTPIDDQGFIVLTIQNPTEQPIKIDLIALGLARTP